MEVAKFSIEYTRFLDPGGKPTQDLPNFAKKETLLFLYKNMLLTRLFDSKAVNLQRTGRLNTYASILGQEAISVGIGAGMQKKDILCPYYRDYGAQLMRGVKMSEILSFWKGNEWGNYFSSCPNDFPICVPIATQLLHAAGVATAIKLRNHTNVVLTTCGDGATSKGDFYEALNIAGVWQLPIVFVINNNQWAISIPRKNQTHAQTLAQKAIAAGIHGEQVDGNDVIAVKFVVEKALDKARKKKGPSVIEALCYRLNDHTTADDASRYCDAADLKQAWKEEPLMRLEKYLFNQNMLSEHEKRQIIDKCYTSIQVAVNEYFDLPDPELKDIFNYHFAKLPYDLEEQYIEADASFQLGEMKSK